MPDEENAWKRWESAGTREARANLRGAAPRRLTPKVIVRGKRPVADAIGATRGGKLLWMLNVRGCWMLNIHLMNLLRPFFLACVAFPSFAADVTRTLPQGQLPDDARLQPLKDLDGYFPWTPPASKEAWAIRADQLRTQMRVALGIWPEPTKTPLNAVIHGKVDRDDYTVERVYFESMPGFFVTGSLYRPKKEGKHPGVLCPHGHWANGRFYEDSDAGVKKAIEKGSEVSTANGKVPLQSRCATLARMGCVVFHYDMLGYADSQQISGELAHKFAKQRAEANAKENWGLYSPQAESHAQSIMGLQAWDSIRSLDFLASLPDVDPARLACTGASGGGTQTFTLAALDPRVKTAFPAVMVSTAMQGGCTCENASLFRVGTGNIEFAALFAPKPMGMTAADDWTKEMPTKGFPDLAAHWAMMGAPKNVQLFPHTEFPHNYNRVSRLAMYGWFNEHLGLGGAKIDEPEIVPLTKDEMTVWDDKHPAPEGGLAFEKKLLRWWHEDAQKQLGASPEKIARPAIEAIFQRTLAGEKATMDHSTLKKDKRGDWLLMSGIIENSARKEALPALFVHPQKWSGRTVIWLSEKGKAALLGDDGQPTAEVQQLVTSGASVMGVDLFMQGEFAFGQQGEIGNRKVKNPRESAAFTYGYNHSLFAQRVHDVLSVLAFTRDHPEHHSQHVALIALDGTAPIAAAARVLSGNFVNALAVNTRGFRFGSVDRLPSASFQPAIAKYGDLPGLLKLGQGALWLDGEGAAPAQTPVNWLLAQ
jgi:dienelactone hydrolase